MQNGVRRITVCTRLTGSSSTPVYAEASVTYSSLSISGLNAETPQVSYVKVGVITDLHDVPSTFITFTVCIVTVCIVTVCIVTVYRF